MADPLEVAPGVAVPAGAISWRAVRSSGPGGQNVNKVSSKVEMRVDLAQVEGLTEDARARLQEIARARLDAEGRLLVTSQRTRDQSRNLEDARSKVRELVARALKPPRPRRPTRPSSTARARRLDAKRVRANQKRARARVVGEE